MQHRMDTLTMEPAENPRRPHSLTPTIIPSSTPLWKTPPQHSMLAAPSACPYDCGYWSIPMAI